MNALVVFEWCFIPLDSNLITCKWIFVTKWNANGHLNKYKAWLVARGFTHARSRLLRHLCAYGLPHGNTSDARYRQQQLYGVPLP